MTLFEKAIGELVEKHESHLSGPAFLIDQVQVIEQLTQTSRGAYDNDDTVRMLTNIAHHARYRLLNTQWNDGHNYQDAPLFLAWSVYDIESHLGMNVSIPGDVSESYESYLCFSQTKLYGA